MVNPKEQFNLSIVTILIAIMVSSCSSNTRLQPQIDQVNGIQKEKLYANQGNTPWSVGQWALYKINSTSREEIFRLFDKDPRPGLRKISISSTYNSSFWLQQHIVWPDQEEHIAALIAVNDPPEENHLTITKLKITQADGKTVEIDEQHLGDDNAADPLEKMQFLVNLLKHSSRMGRSRTITVPAGTFENTNEVPISMSLLLGQVKGSVLYSDAIPILRLAKMQITQDTSGWFKNTITWELADFGLQDIGTLPFDKK